MRSLLHVSRACKCSFGKATCTTALVYCCFLVLVLFLSEAPLHSLEQTSVFFKIARALCLYPVALTCCAVNFADRSPSSQGRCNLRSQTFSVSLLDLWGPGQNCFKTWGLTAKVELGRDREAVQVQRQNQTSSPVFPSDLSMR